MQIVGAAFIGVLLDNKRIGTRRTRGFVSLAAVSVIVLAGWIGITVWLYKNPLDPLNPPLYDWTDGPFGGFFVLNLLFVMNLVIVSHILRASNAVRGSNRFASQYQVLAQWILATFTNSPEELARFAGLAKGVLAGGIATSFGTEAAGLTQLHVIACNFTLQAVGLVCMAFVVWNCDGDESPKGRERHTAR